MSATQASDVATRFLDALSRRDFEELAATFTENGRLRGLVPSTLRELEGREAIAERFRIWNSDDDWELLEADATEFSDLVKLHWRVALSVPDLGPTVYEQTAYAEMDDDGISWMNLVCSGHRRAS